MPRPRRAPVDRACGAWLVDEVSEIQVSGAGCLALLVVFSLTWGPPLLQVGMDDMGRVHARSASGPGDAACRVPAGRRWIAHVGQGW